jgi:hypothetical protein
MVVVIALVSAGCIGSSGSSSPAPSTGHSPGIPALTDVTITYTIPTSTCPPGGKCLVSAHGYTLVRRHLTCSPDVGGDYDDPAAACRALTDLVTKLKKPHGVCSCPAQLRGYKPPKVVGIYRGKRRTISLDGCSLCGVGDVLPDAAMLMPVP